MTEPVPAMKANQKAMIDGQLVMQTATYKQLQGIFGRMSLSWWQVSDDDSSSIGLGLYVQAERCAPM